jgi:putative transposase
MAKTHYKALLEKVLLGFLTADDPVQAMLEWVAHQMMLIEAENKVGAEKGKHSKDRKTHFSGVRVRRMDTRLGTIYLYIPKLRKGGYVPFFVTERKRSEMALATLVQEAFINGVSTRRIERLAQALGVENISASQVSEMNKELEGQVESFRTRPLEEEYPFLMIDAHYDKVRVEDRVMTLALMIAHGVNSDGIREILAVEPMFDESEDTWRAFFQKLKKRGLRRVNLCISDAHAGIQAAVKKELLGASWQRCKVHFMRNILAKVPHKEKRRFSAHLKQIWLQPDKKSAKRAAAQLVQEYGERFPEATRCLEEGLEDSLQFYAFPEIDPKKISSTNMSERTIREVRRRSRVVGIFPSIGSWVRLDTCYLMEYSEDWPTDRSYIKREKVQEALERGRAFLAAQAAS